MISKVEIRKNAKRYQNNIFLPKKTGSNAFLLMRVFPHAMFYPFEFYIKRCSFHGLSESSPIFLGHLDNSALPAKILKKIGVKNYQKVVYFDFLLQKWGYIGKAIYRIL